MKNDSLMSTVDFRFPAFDDGWEGRLWQGQWLGQHWLDLFGDSGAASLGARSQQHVDLYSEMKVSNTHVPSVHGTSDREAVTAKLCEMTGQDKAFWCTSGAEAVEAAIKIARKHSAPGRYKIASFFGDFHGRTYGAMSASFGPSYHRDGYQPLAPGFYSFEHLEDIDWKTTAGVIICPMFCDHDFREHPHGFLENLENACKWNGIPLIFDEVQTGSGRTGAMTYGQLVNVKPDILCLAKGIGMGVPVGITLAQEPYADVFRPGTHFSTFGGNSLQVKAVRTYLDWMNTGGLAIVQAASEIWRAGLRDIFDHDPRGRGLCMAVDVESNEDFLAAATEQRLVMGIFKKGAGGVRITPALNMSMLDIQEALERLAKAKSAC